MMTARQILLLFGFFLSMFYIFKYGAIPTGERQEALCAELQNLQSETVAAMSPIIRADTSNVPFEIKIDAAMKSLRTSPDHIIRQNNIRKLKGKLGGQTCPAPGMTQLVKLAVGT